MSTAVEQRTGMPASAGANERERLARVALRAQLVRMERRLSVLAVRGSRCTSPTLAASTPGLLGLAELERARDGLVARIAEAEQQLAERSRGERAARELLRCALLDPRRYKFLRIAVADLGLGSCGAWEVRPRLGPIGMLAGWWQVKLSSGCP